MTSKRPSASDRRSAQALDLFERAMKALGKRDFDKALDLFDDLIRSHPEASDVLERARTYRAACERSLDKRPSFRPRTFEELLNHGVFLHNRGEHADALRYLQQAAEQHPKNEHVQYCIAAAAARSGELQAAKKALRAALVANPANRAQARLDPDFEALRGDEEFLALMAAQAS